MPSEAEYAEQALHDERQAIKAERDALRTEVARLREVADDATLWHQLFSEEVVKVNGLVSETKRLRAALRRLYEYADELEGSMTPWIVTRPGIASLPRTEDERIAIGKEVRDLLGIPEPGETK